MAEKGYGEYEVDHEALGEKIALAARVVCRNDLVTQDRTVAALLASAVGVWEKSAPVVTDILQKLKLIDDEPSPESQALLHELRAALSANGFAGMICSAVLDTTSPIYKREPETPNGSVH